MEGISIFKEHISGNLSLPALDDNNFSSHNNRFTHGGRPSPPAKLSAIAGALAIDLVEQ